MYYVVWFLLAWFVWLIFADKARWREILPVCIFAKALSLATDVLMFYYPLWEYIGPPYFIHLGELGIYPVVTYLFIQWLPKKQVPKNMLIYWFVWTTLAIAIEMIYVTSGHMRYHQWWDSWHSYAADWLLYWIFFKFHSVLGLERLSPNK